MYHYLNKIKEFLQSNNLRSAKTGAGFTLIELLVGMAIMITSTTIILAIIMSAVRVSGKVTVSDNARQNGTYAMNRMIKIVQFADSYVGGSNNANSLTNGNWAQTCNNTSYQLINVVYSTEQKVLQCRGGSIYLINLTPSRTDEELISSNNVAVSNCEFVCTRIPATASPVISIRYNLSIGGSEGAVEKKTSIPFFTSVKMRNQ